MLREAIASAEPSLLPLVDTVGVAPLTQEQRNALRRAVAHNLVATGFGSQWEPNVCGVRLEALIDYLVHV
ncbi:MAG: hypothetical protein ACR2M3_06645 [Thermomicrobiales bacterium]